MANQNSLNTLSTEELVQRIEALQEELRMSWQRWCYIGQEDKHRTEGTQL